MQETLVRFLGQEDALEKGQAIHFSIQGFPGGSDGKESACNVGDLGSIPGLQRYPGRGHGKPLQYSCLENPHEQRSLAGYSAQGCKESDMTERLSTVAAAAAKSLQLCLTLCEPINCSLPGSSVHGDSLDKNTGVGCRAFL